MLVMAVNQPYKPSMELTNDLDIANQIIDDELAGYEANPMRALEMLFFALFGLTRPEDLQMTKKVDSWVESWVKLIMATYLLLTGIVLINLLIAMMSDTYQRISQESDVEWEKGRTTLIRNMHRTNASPAPINLITTWALYLHQIYKRRQKKKDKYKRMKNEPHKKSGKVSPYPGEATSSTDLGIGAMGSSSSVRSRQFLENSVNWGPIIKKYRNLKIETPEHQD